MLRGKKWKKLANTLSAPSLPLPQKKSERKTKKKNWKRIFNALKKAVWERCKKKDICDKPGWYCLDWPGAEEFWLCQEPMSSWYCTKNIHFYWNFTVTHFVVAIIVVAAVICSCCIRMREIFFVPLFFLRRGAHLRTSLELSELSR